VLESTPDLALHASLRGDEYAGKTLLVRGYDPKGELVWSYPHVQRGAAFDMVLPVFGSSAARKHLAGQYRFEVSGAGTIVAAGEVTFTSQSGATYSGGAP
jgi:hypothetical protein